MFTAKTLAGFLAASGLAAAGPQYSGGSGWEAGSSNNGKNGYLSGSGKVSPSAGYPSGSYSSSPYYPANTTMSCSYPTSYPSVTYSSSSSYSTSCSSSSSSSYSTSYSTSYPSSTYSSSVYSTIYSTVYSTIYSTVYGTSYSTPPSGVCTCAPASSYSSSSDSSYSYSSGSYSSSSSSSSSSDSYSNVSTTTSYSSTYPTGYPSGYSSGYPPVYPSAPYRNQTNDCSNSPTTYSSSTVYSTGYYPGSSTASSSGYPIYSTGSPTYGSGASKTAPVDPNVVTHTVTAGAGGHLIFDPPNIQARVGEVIEFNFLPKNHSVAQSSFDEPCKPLKDRNGREVGFFAGFDFATQDGLAPDVFQIVVRDTKPIWFYCPQTVGNHCQQGMAGVINQDYNSVKTLAAYIKAANMTGMSTVPSEVRGGHEFLNPHPLGGHN